MSRFCLSGWKAAVVNIAAFQIGWFACALGGSAVGGVVVAAILGAHLYWLGRPGEWRLLAGFAGLGLMIDGSFSLLGGFSFDAASGGELALAGAGAGPSMPLPLPAWLWLLWLLFATLPQHSLTWLWPRPWLAALGGATSGPLSYLAGARLSGVELAPWLLPAEAVVWALLCLGLSWHYRKRPAAE
ncbi:DUF2878 domain-containing protein [Halomonas salinarum]|uniref:DUF2878 domain-containing protein n=1 Tax=Halomonas salinarum TaxID=1158993 RepID=UPI00143B416F|nr:DUF2878 domain-containing protein [Halomonas salinarum]